MRKYYKLLVEGNFVTLTISARKIYDHPTLNRNKRQFPLENEIKDRIIKFVAKQMKGKKDIFNYIRISFMEFITQQIYFGLSYQT
jgi:hypothetical protein